MDSRAWRHGLVFDLVICAALMAFGAGVTTRSDAAGAGTSIDTVLLPAVILPLLLRRTRPLAAAAALAGGCVVSGIPTFDQFRLGVAIPSAMLILYSLARDTGRRRASVGLVLVLAGMVFIGFTDVVLRDHGGVGAMIAFSFPLCIGIWAGGRVVRSRDRLAGELVARSRLLEQRRDESAQLAVEVERSKLASQLDAAARERIRKMVQLAGRGEQHLATDPEEAQAVFARIETMGRRSLNEMRGLLGVLRSDERGTRVPRPTLAQLDTLLAEARSGGRLVDLDVEGERRALPGGVELAAYRVLQHALVAIRGADSEPARIQLRYMPAALELEVRGAPADGRGPEAALAAARERVAAHGGSFTTTRPSPTRRVLRARLPLVATHG